VSSDPGRCPPAERNLHDAPLPNARPVYKLLKRGFAGVRLTGRGSATSRTSTDKGWLYVTTVLLGGCSRRLLAWSIADGLRTEPRTGTMSTQASTPGPGRARIDRVVFHPTLVVNTLARLPAFAVIFR
jgi:hypothetical protein